MLEKTIKNFHYTLFAIPFKKCSKKCTLLFDRQHFCPGFSPRSWPVCNIDNRKNVVHLPNQSNEHCALCNWNAIKKANGYRYRSKQAGSWFAGYRFWIHCLAMLHPQRLHTASPGHVIGKNESPHSRSGLAATKSGICSVQCNKKTIALFRSER